MADRLLRRSAARLDGPGLPRWPLRMVARAQVHGLLGEKDRALDVLDRAYDAGYRDTLGRALLYAFAIPTRAGDSAMFAGIRNEPRLTAWLARIRADNARQLAQLQSEDAPNR